MTELFDRLYARFGARYPYLLLFLAGASIPLATALIAAALTVSYFDASFSEYLQILLVGMPFMALVGACAELAVARTIYGPLLAWLRGPREEAGAEEAWHAAVTGLPRAILLATAIAMPGAIPIEIYGAGVALEDDSTLGVVGTVVAGSGFAALVIVIHYFLWERSLRPVAADIARRLPTDFAPQARSPSVGVRLLLLIPAICMATGVMSAGISTDSLGPSGKLAVGLGVALGLSSTAGLIVTLLLRRSLTRPLEDLLEAMKQVREGDLHAHLPVVSGDELGVATHHFNTMLQGLQERERLAQENERLHERIRAQLEEVEASRARIVAASDAERRRVERNLHDGAQQHLVGLALQLELLKERVAADPELTADLGRAGEQLSQALSELRELARGLHPQVLTAGGLNPALKQLAQRSPVRVEVAATEERFPETVESTAYFVVSEALANIAKYAEASRAEISAERHDGRLVVSVKDDGVGGADAGAGSGLAGLSDRVTALGGRLQVESPKGAGTYVTAELPIE